MRAHLSVITRKGQITVPADIRRSLGLKQGDTVAFHLEDGAVKLTPTHSRLAEGYQSIPALDDPKTWTEIAETVRDERAVHHAAKSA